MYTSEAIEKMVNILSSLPTIGKKTAQRLTFHLLKTDEEFIRSFSDSLIDIKQKVKFCSVCFNYTEMDPCPICNSQKRKRNVLCVVEDPTDVIAIEKTNEYFGLYHVLHGVISPLEGISPNDLKIKELLGRLDGLEEIILAVNPSIEGEATAQYIAKLLKPFEIRVTRIASGMPIGSSLEFTDELTISKALSSRFSI
ncbi:MAG: recombination protein RecR [Ignavibacteria bacterium GWF2_33_9]|nr:MAG: recombination protein RecR [Ignavibacteria bacterium GWF2_33_9]